MYIRGESDREAEIRQFHLALAIDEDVVALDVFSLGVSVIITAMDPIVAVQTVQRPKNALTHVRDETLLDVHVGAENARQRALLHELHHDPQLIAPVETVANEHDVAVVTGLLESELIADVHQLAQ